VIHAVIPHILVQGADVAVRAGALEGHLVNASGLDRRAAQAARATIDDVVAAGVRLPSGSSRAVPGDRRAFGDKTLSLTVIVRVAAVPEIALWPPKATAAASDSAIGMRSWVIAESLSVPEL
jgi:hypothetical protein